MAGGSRDAELVDVFAQVARTLFAARTWEAVLDRICEAAVAVVPGCESAGTSIVQGSVIRTLASVGEMSAMVDAVQYETGEGPCLDAIREHEVFETGDLSAEDRWPRFAERAARQVGVRSMLAIRLHGGEDTYGALNLCARRVNAFGDESRAVAGVLAAHGAVAFAGAKDREKIETLQQGLRTREVIGQAMGILMNRRHLNADEAFELLVRVSQHLNVKLRSLAQDLASGRTNPDDVG